MKLSFKTKSLMAAMSFASLALVTGAASAVQTVDAGIPDYQKASGIAGNLSSVGSDTLANLMTLWAEEFSRQYPTVNVQIQAAGSSTAPPAL
ncbi:MAG: phosphate-binding protein, partial [Methylococcaceae bacterium]